MGSRESRKAAPRSGLEGDDVMPPWFSDPVAIGVVVGPHGVRGTLRVRALGSGRHIRENIEPVLGGAKRRISHVRQTPKGFLVDVEGIDSRAVAVSLKCEALLLGRDQLDAPEEDEFYVADLVGLTALNDAGEIIGTVEDTFETAAHEVLVVREQGGNDLYVPFTLDHVPEVQLGSRRVVIRPPES